MSPVYLVSPLDWYSYIYHLLQSDKVNWNRPYIYVNFSCFMSVIVSLYDPPCQLCQVCRLSGPNNKKNYTNFGKLVLHPVECGRAKEKCFLCRKWFSYVHNTDIIAFTILAARRVRFYLLHTIITQSSLFARYLFFSYCTLPVVCVSWRINNMAR